MKITSKSEFLENLEYYRRKILKGAVFIYPTDTIYGIGCNATISFAVKKIRLIKRRPASPFSVAVPSKKWIRQNCFVPKAAEEWLNRLPGPYTLLLKLKSRKAVAKAANPDTDVLGIRMPKNWFSKTVAVLKVPVISTSVNLTGKNHMTSIKDLPPEVSEKVDFIIYERKLRGNPSQIVNFEKGKAEILSR